MDAEAGEPGEHAGAAGFALPGAPERAVMESGIGRGPGFGHAVSPLS